MKLFSSQQIKDWDAYTMRSQHVSDVELMERAAMACTRYLLESISAEKKFIILCGNGNNGGDGLAIGRLLTEQGRAVDVYIVGEETKRSNCFVQNLKSLQQITKSVYFIRGEVSFPLVGYDDCVVDCLFGTGLNRPPQGLHAALIKHVNTAKAYVISVDVPSGMFIDRASDLSVTIQATVTLSFQSTKLCFLTADNAAYFGRVVILPIGLEKDFADKTDTVFTASELELVKKLYKPRKEFSHKGHHGHALLIAGSEGKTGAAILSAKACLRAGAGLLTCCLHNKSFSAMNIALPEAMTIDAEDLHELTKFKAIGIGPGLGNASTAKNLLATVLENNIPTVADADALNMMAADRKQLSLLPAGSVITPHPKEFDRLFGASASGFERIEKAIRFSSDNEITIVLKDHHTLIVHRGKGVFNMNGNAGLAKGGSGDVLTGIILALLAQGYSGFDAAVLGCYLHGAAADAALYAQSTETMLATDVIDNLHNAFKLLYR